MVRFRTDRGGLLVLRYGSVISCHVGSASQPSGSALHDRTEDEEDRVGVTVRAPVVMLPPPGSGERHGVGGSPPPAEPYGSSDSAAARTDGHRPGKRLTACSGCGRSPAPARLVTW
ncbi:hypothetical protein GCM10010420_54880 [Streptomyces glaucosporus]|uniref:Uncharacterized protein n=1 Tax=Streptomyces glaucosporus TaxID=284044 RepID=A0ABP5W495_9ACTN